MNMKVVSLIGARPQFIKEAILCEQLKARNIDEVVVNSGQHYDHNMSDVFFSSLNIKQPKYNLNVGSGKHGEMTAKIMIEFEKVLEKEKPDIVLVYGDTNTTLAGAIVASKMKIKTGHIEAGLRMLPKDMPEEINRVLVDSIADLMFCPSQKAVDNLRAEGKNKGVYFTGDVMFDLYLKMEKSFKYDVYDELNLKSEDYAILTLHRDYNVDHRDKLEKILLQLNKVSRDTKIVFPIHPRTSKRIQEFGFKDKLTGLTVIEPVDYLNLMGLVKRSKFVITDSGGLQKEAYFSSKRAYVLMPDTGWIELVENKNSVLCDETNIYQQISDSSKASRVPNIYGVGDAGKKIVDILCK